MSLSLRDFSVSATLPRFTPPPRFGETRFSDYSPQHSSQELALHLMQGFFKQANKKKPWPWQKQKGKGLYLDGGFGVGKTHLLASAYAAYEDQKLYLSFSELVYVIGVLGKEEAKAQIGQYKLYCIDEFELDDPGNTLIVKTFLAHVFKEGAHVITTSNTLPEAQGEGRFNARDFKREIQSIAAHFETVSIGGPDYRKRTSIATLLSAAELKALFNSDVSDKPKVKTSWQELFQFLSEHHPIRYTQVLEKIGVLYIEGAKPIARQNDALRFVHFIDKLYDFNLGLRVSGQVSLDKLFDETYVNGAYAKKHYRCLSRISELLEEDNSLSLAC